MPIRNTLLNEVNIVKGTVLRRPVEQRIRGGMTLYKTSITDGEDDMQLTFFNNRYITSLLTEGAVYAFRGKVTGTFMRREMASPEFVPESRMQDMVPVYPQTSGLTSRIIANAVKEALRLLPETVKDPLPDALRLKYALCRLEYALKTIHFRIRPKRFPQRAGDSCSRNCSSCSSAWRRSAAQVCAKIRIRSKRIIQKEFAAPAPPSR